MSARGDFLTRLKDVKDGDPLRAKAVEAWLFVSGLPETNSSIPFGEMKALDLSFAIDVVLLQKEESKQGESPASLHRLSPPMHGQRDL